MSLLAAIASLTKRALIIFSSSVRERMQVLHYTKSSGLASSSLSSSQSCSAIGLPGYARVKLEPLLPFAALILLFRDILDSSLLQLNLDFCEFFIDAAPIPPEFSISCWARSLLSLAFVETFPSTSMNFFFAPQSYSLRNDLKSSSTWRLQLSIPLRLFNRVLPCSNCSAVQIV